MPGRDPKAWKLYASGDGKNYRLVDEQSGIFWPESATGKGRRQTKTFPMKKGNYRYFKLVITELVAIVNKHNSRNFRSTFRTVIRTTPAPLTSTMPYKPSFTCREEIN